MTLPLLEPELRLCRILHLEDSAIDADLVSANLEHSGLHEAICLVGTRTAYVRALQEQAFDLILADYVLPDFDGLTALALARELAPATPFIFVSGTMGEEAAVEAVRQGATDYIVKQRLARLPVAVRRALDDAHARAGQRRTLVALRESEARLRLALEAGRLGTWEFDLRSNVLTASTHFQEAFGHEGEQAFTYSDFRNAIHPEDRDRMDLALARSIEEDVDYDIEYRVVWSDGAVRWLQIRGRTISDADGVPWGLAGVSLDITERKLAEDRQTLLSREVDHRAKNALAVVQAVLRLTKAEDVPSYIRAIEGRVASLVRAQALLAEDRWAGADLRALMKGEFMPFLGADLWRVSLDGPRVTLPVSAVQSMAMIAHELATNAVKYGALSTSEGRVAVSWHCEKNSSDAVMLILCWMETGGPQIQRAPGRRGFGGRMLDSTARLHLGGKLELAWEPTGLICHIHVPLSPDAKAQDPSLDERSLSTSV